MIVLMLFAAVAGEMYVGSGPVPPGTFDGRELVFDENAFVWPVGFAQHWSLTFNRFDGYLYSCYLYDPLVPAALEARYLRWDAVGGYLDLGVCGFQIPGAYFTSTYYNPHTRAIEDSGQNFPREWVDPMDMAVGWNGAALEGIRPDGSVVPVRSTEILAHLPEVTTLAWDGDTRLLWVFGSRYLFPDAVAVDPATGRVVGELWDTILGPYHATGFFDTHPTQTPELLVTGQCPGTVYVTLVDGTPGGRAFIASGTVDGPALLPAGACGDVELGIADPVRRASLPINSYGIASTTFQATPGQCGAQLLQALDLRTCTPTQVRTVPAP